MTKARLACPVRAVGSDKRSCRKQRGRSWQEGWFGGTLFSEWLIVRRGQENLGSGGGRGGGGPKGQEARPRQPSAGHPHEETPQKHPAHVFSSGRPHFPLSARPWFILTRLFPPSMGTRPCRHREAPPTPGTGVHCGKPEASRPCATGCGKGPWASPPGEARGCGLAAGGG